MNLLNKIFSKKTIVILYILGIIIGIIVFFILHYIYQKPFLSNLIVTILSIIALTGIFLFYNNYIKIGIILQVINITGFVIINYIFKENIFTFYFIIFLLILIWNIYDIIKEKINSASKD